METGWGGEPGQPAVLTSLAIGNLGNGSTCRESYGDGVEVSEAASISVDRPLAVLPPLPLCLGLLPQSLAFLLFWFNKTKSGALAARVRGELPGHTLIATQNHHPQVPEPSSSFNTSILDSVSMLPTALPSPQPFSVFLGPGGLKEIGSQMEQLESGPLRASSAPLFPSSLLSPKTLSFPLLAKGRGSQIQRAPA